MMITNKARSARPYHVRRAALVLSFILVACLAGCEPTQQRLQDHLTVHRIPKDVDRVSLAPEVITTDNCDSNATQERWIERSQTIGEVVSLDQEETKSVAAAIGAFAGVSLGEYIGPSAGLEAKLEFQKMISERVGTGLVSGQTKTQGIKIIVGPRQTAVTTLQWIETWEEGYVEVFYDDRYVGAIDYHLLVDLRLDTSTKTYDCSLLGRAKQALAIGSARMGIYARSTWQSLSEKLGQLKGVVEKKWQAAKEAWPLGHLEWWAAAGAVMVGGLAIAAMRKRQRSREMNDDFYG